MQVWTSTWGCVGARVRDLAARRGRLEPPLAAAAAGVVAAGAFLALLLPLSPGRLERPSADLIPALPHWAALADLAPAWLSDPRAVGLAVLLACGAAFGAWALAIAACWDRPARRGPLALVVGTSLVLLGISAAALPNVNTDVYNYMARGRLASAHGVSPYRVAVDAFPEDPAYPYASHRFTARPGGKPAAFMLLDVALTALAGDSVVRTLFAYRLTLLALAAASLALVAAILRRLAPRHLLAGLVLFGWSPIVTFHAPGKSDTAMAFVLLAALWLVARGRPRVAAVAFAVSVLVKLLTLPVAALWGVRELRLRGLREASIGAGLALATAAALYLPFGSLDALARHALQVGDGGADAPGGLENVARGAFVLLFLAVAFTRTADLASLLRGGAWLMLALVPLLTPFPLSWYQISVLAIACLVPDVRVALAALALGLPALAQNVWHSTSTSSFPMPEPLSLAVPLLLALLALAAVGGVLLFPGLRRLRAPEGVPRGDTRLDTAG
jgi:hypothetical protein